MSEVNINRLSIGTDLYRDDKIFTTLPLTFQLYLDKQPVANVVVSAMDYIENISFHNRVGAWYALSHPNIGLARIELNQIQEIIPRHYVIGLVLEHKLNVYDRLKKDYDQRMTIQKLERVVREREEREKMIEYEKYRREHSPWNPQPIKANPNAPDKDAWKWDSEAYEKLVRWYDKK